MSDSGKYKKMPYPKILIIGQDFNLTTGGGITLSALFKEWPGNCIAVANPRIEIETVERCEKTYRLGYSERKRPWPFNIGQRRIRSGAVEIKKETNRKSDHQENGGEGGSLKPVVNMAYKIIHFSGLYPFIYRMKVSEEFLQWVKEYDPDIIYTQLSSIDYMQFVTKLVKKTKLPLAIHIMDDWPATLEQPGLLFYYWKRRIDRMFRSLLNYSHVRMSICSQMSEEYFDRYKLDFIPFHNTVDVGKWFGVAKSNWGWEQRFTILYAGRIGRGTSESILTVAQAVEKLAEQGLRVTFQLQTKELPQKFAVAVKHLKHTVKNDFIDYEKLPEKFSSVDLLILPMDFDQYNLKFIRLSMPTKVPEYLASGTPVLVFAPGETALAKYASDSKWGYVVSENCVDALAASIKHLYDHIELREKLGRTGMKMVLKNHDAAKVRKDFRYELIKATK